MLLSNSLASQSGIQVPSGNQNNKIDLAFKMWPSDQRIGDPQYESTAIFSSPANGSLNRMILSTGSSAQVINYAVSDKSITQATATNAVTKVKAADDIWIGTDNQVVRLASGDVLIQRDSMTTQLGTGTDVSWKNTRTMLYDASTAKWFSKTAAHGCFTFFRSNPKSLGLEYVGMLNLAEYESGTFGRPRPMSAKYKADVSWDQQGKDKDGIPMFWPGSGDRTELYCCPFTNNLYLTTRVISGPSTKKETAQDLGLLFGSKDEGKTWKLLKKFDGWSPFVMTSTPDGRLWVLNQNYAGMINADTAFLMPKLLVSRPVAKNTLPEGFNEKLFSEKEFDRAAGPNAVAMEVKQSHPSIARLINRPGGEGVLLSYQVQNSMGNQEICIVKAQINGGIITTKKICQLNANKFNKNIAAKTTSKVSTEESGPRKDHSAMYAAFIQPDLAGVDPSLWRDDSVLYWIDAHAPVAKDPHYTARYAFFSGGELVNGGFLSSKDGVQRDWLTQRDPGDYMKSGSFFNKDKSISFVPVWCEFDGLHATMITVK